MSYDVVVIGLGYVGLPLAIEAARAGLVVRGLDLDAGLTARVNAGRSHIDDVTDADVRTALQAGFAATTDESVLAATATVVVCVPTPLGPADVPDLSAVTAAMTAVSRHLRPGTLVVLESTTYPGTTDEVVRPILESSGLRAGADFSLAFSPERIDPGNPVYGLRNTPKVVGGHTPGCTGVAAGFYGKFVDRVVYARGTREAEMAKLLENTYRHVNIALVNEMAVFCHELGVDLWDAIDCAATKPFGFQAFRPGPGVGGHCIPIDPNYLSYKVRTLGYPFRFVELAQEVNARMPGYVVHRAQSLLNAHDRPLRGSSILLLGVTYKPDIADRRESPALPIARRLRAEGASVCYADPYVPEWTVDGEPVSAAGDLYAALGAADLTILLQRHRCFDLPRIERSARLLFDTSGTVRGGHAALL